MTLRELRRFLREEKRWWLTPIVVVLVLVGLLAAVLAADPGFAPFLYSR